MWVPLRKPFPAGGEGTGGDGFRLGGRNDGKGRPHSSLILRQAQHEWPRPARRPWGGAILARDLEALTAHIFPVPPFDFGLTARHACWYAEGLKTERFEDGVWTRLTRAGDRAVLLTVSAVGSVEEPRLEVRAEGEGLGEESMGALMAEVEWRLSTGYDLAGFYEMAERDAALSKTTGRFRGLKPGLDTDLFESLVGTILGQQLSTAVALTMQRGLIEKYGERVSVNGEEYWLSPTPERFMKAGVEELKTCKLSARKSEYIYGISKAVALGEMDLDSLWDMSSESVTETLVGYRGIGLWTAHRMLCHALGRFDVLPTSDLYLLKTISNVFMDGRAVSPQDVEAFTDRWGEYKALAMLYMYAGLGAGMDLNE